MMIIISLEVSRPIAIMLIIMISTVIIACIPMIWDAWLSDFLDWIWNYRKRKRERIDFDEFKKLFDKEK